MPRPGPDGLIRIRLDRAVVDRLTAIRGALSATSFCARDHCLPLLPVNRKRTSFEAEVLSALVQSKRNRRDRLKLVLFREDRNLRERDRVDPR